MPYSNNSPFILSTNHITNHFTNHITNLITPSSY